MGSRSGGGSGSGGGSRSGGGVQIGWGGTGKGFVVEYIFCIGGMWGKNFLKFSQIFSNFLEGGGVPDPGGLSDTFLVLVFLWGNFFLKFSQIFSNFLGIHFYVLAIFSNFLKFSQIFSNFLKFSQNFSKVSVDFEQNICPK